MGTKYDIEQYERLIREKSAQAMAECEERIKAGLMDRDFYEAQFAFDEAQTQFALAAARVENADRSAMISAAGIAVGSIVASIISDLDPAEQVQFYTWLAKASEDVGAVEGIDGAVITHARVSRKETH